MKANSSKYYGQIPLGSNPLNYFQALKQLKQAQASVEKKKKHLRVMAIRSQRGAWVEIEQEQKAELRKQFKMQNMMMQESIAKIKMKQLQKVNQLRKMSQKKRAQQLKNRSKSRIQALEQKIRRNNEIKKQSKEYSANIQHFKSNILSQKSMKCRQLYEKQKQSRMAYEAFQNSRVNEVRSSKSRERDSIMEKLKQMREELSFLQQVQDIQTFNDREIQPNIKSSNIRSTQSSALIYKSSARSKYRKKSASEAKILSKDSNINLQV